MFISKNKFISKSVAQATNKTRNQNYVTVYDHYFEKIQ